MRPWMRGVNFIDTADVYGDGRSERLIARLKKERKEQLIVATKAGRKLPRQTVEGYSRRGGYRAGLTTACGISRGRDAFDLLQVALSAHGRLLSSRGVRDPRATSCRRESCVSAWRERRARGRGHQGDQLPNVQSVQYIFNCFRQRPAEVLFSALAKERKVGILARVPLASGMLTGKLGRGYPVCGRRSPQLQSPWRGGLTSARRFRRGLRRGAFGGGRATRRAAPAGHVADATGTAWILMFDAVTCAIPGGKRPSQVADNALASTLPPLTPEVMASVRKIYDAKIRPLVHQLW